VFSIKYLLILLLTASFLLAGCSSLPKSGMDGCTSQPDALTVKKETAEMKGDVVVFHASLPPQQLSLECRMKLAFLINLLKRRADNFTDTARFSVKEVLWGNYNGIFKNVTRSVGEFGSFWESGEYVLLFFKRKCYKTSIVKIGACDYGYIDAKKPVPNDPEVHICEEKVCKPHYDYSDTFSSKILHDVGGIPFIVNTNLVEYFQKQWGLQVEHFESEVHKASKGIRFDSLRKCLKAGKCLPP
jgi:hypothetical protein